MSQNPTKQKLEKKECHCILCESGDRDMKEFYTVRIESGHGGVLGNTQTSNRKSFGPRPRSFIEQPAKRPKISRNSLHQIPS